MIPPLTGSRLSSPVSQNTVPRVRIAQGSEPVFGGLFQRSSPPREVALMFHPGGYRAADSIPLTRYTGVYGEASGGMFVFFPAFQANTWDKPIQTCGMGSCAAVAVINDRTGRHYLAHFTSDLTPQTIAKSIRQNIDVKDSRVYILPGEQTPTRDTVRHILTGLESLEKGLSYKAQFVHYPTETLTKDENWVKSMISYQGQVWVGTSHDWLPGKGTAID
jgi:hypothetical protein